MGESENTRQTKKAEDAQLINNKRRNTMAPLDPKEGATVEEIVMSNVCIMEAIINVLEDKGVLNRRELQEELRRLSKNSKKPEKK